MTRTDTHTHTQQEQQIDNNSRPDEVMPEMMASASSPELGETGTEDLNVCFVLV